MKMSYFGTSYSASGVCRARHPSSTIEVQDNADSRFSRTKSTTSPKQGFVPLLADYGGLYSLIRLKFYCYDASLILVSQEDKYIVHWGDHTGFLKTDPKYSDTLSTVWVEQIYQMRQSWVNPKQQQAFSKLLVLDGRRWELDVYKLPNKGYEWETPVALERQDPHMLVKVIRSL